MIVIQGMHIVTVLRRPLISTPTFLISLLSCCLTFWSPHFLVQTLDKHTNLATALLGAIKSRGLDGWHNTAEDVLCGKSDLQSVIKLVSGTRGTAADRLRLALIWLLAYDGG
jgi:hypothetical protein